MVCFKGRMPSSRRLHPSGSAAWQNRGVRGAGAFTRRFGCLVVLVATPPVACGPIKVPVFREIGPEAAASDLWTKLSAVGTLAASVIALAVAVGPLLWRRYWRRPKLEVQVGAGEPWARLTKLVGDGEQQVWLRIEVKNEGRAEARNVRTVVHAWYERSDGTAQWEKRDLDPSALHWVSMSHYWQGEVPRDTPPAVNLPAELGDFVDLVRYSIGTGEHVLVVDDPRPRGFGFRPTHTIGEYVVTITVVADNADGVTKHIHYCLTRENLFSEVRLAKAPPKDYRFTGLLSMIERMKNADDVPPTS